MAINTVNTQSNVELTNLIENAKKSKLDKSDNGQSFLTEFKSALDKISQQQITANDKANAFEMGDPSVSLNEVMVDMQKSSVSLQFGIQVRNKLISAYQDIMNMNV